MGNSVTVATPPKRAVPWWINTCVEGAAKAVSSIFQRLVGFSMGTIEMGCVSAIIIGAVQSAAGIWGVVAGSTGDTFALRFIPNRRAVLWALLFGVTAGIGGTVWSIYTFTLGADLTFRTLIVSLSIIPAAALSWAIWGDRFGPAQWVGILFFLAAVWGMLDFDLAVVDVIIGLPIWVFATLVNTGVQTANEIISRKTADAKLDQHANNFWVGTSTIISCTLLLVVLLLVRGEDVSLSAPFVFVWGSLAMGGIVTVMIVYKILAYAAGGTVAPKKIIMYWTFLGLAYVFDMAFFDVSFSIAKTASVLLLFPVAAVLTDKDGYRWFEVSVLGHSK